MSEQIEHEVYVEPPTVEHVETITDGLLDMLNGVESYNTRYTQAVLECAGYVSKREVAGNEGFFSSIGAGIKKVIDYIINMFKSLWNWITGGSSGGSSSGGSSASRNLKQVADKTATSLAMTTAVENGVLVQSKKDADAVADVLKKKASRQPASKKQKTEEQVERIKTAPTPAVAIKVANEVALEVYEEEMSQADIDAIDTRWQRVQLENIERLLARKRDEDRTAPEFATALINQIELCKRYLVDIESTLVSNRHDAARLVKLAVDFHKDLEQTQNELGRRMGGLTSRIKTLEQLQLVSPENIGPEEKETIDDMKSLLQDCATLISITNNVLRELSKMDPDKQTLEDMFNRVELKKKSTGKSYLKADGTRMSGEELQRYILTGRK